MTMQDSLAEAYAELSGLLIGEESLETTLQRVADLAVVLVPHCDLAAVTVKEERGYTTAASTDALALEIDEDQYRAGEGPCLDAIEHNRVNRVDDCAAERRWPDFARNALDKGLSSFLALPLVVRGEPIGAMNLYSKQPRGFTEVDEELCRLFTGAAAAALANAQLYRSAIRLVDQMRDALDSRAVIEQAKGVLMAREGCGPEEAFRILSTTSQQANRKLRDIAERIVSGIDGEGRSG